MQRNAIKMIGAALGFSLAGLAHAATNTCDAALNPTGTLGTPSFCVASEPAHITVQLTVPAAKLVQCKWSFVVYGVTPAGAAKTLKLLTGTFKAKYCDGTTPLLFTTDLSAKLNKQLAKKAILKKLPKSANEGALILDITVKPAYGGTEKTRTVVKATIYLTRFSISGTVNGPAPAGLAIYLTGAATNSMVTSANGAYLFGGLLNGAYTVRAESNGFQCTPAARSVTIDAANTSSVDFAASPVCISGSITGALSANVVVQLTGAASASTVTSANGAYLFSGLLNGAYTLYPQNSEFSFAPSCYSVTIDAASVSSVDFTSYTNSYPDMALIPAGAFAMGDCVDAGEDWSGELPVHTVMVSAFSMDKREVTSQQWHEVRTWALVNGYTIDAGSGKAATHPVQTVSWYDCVKWCNARSEREGRTPCYYTSAVQTQIYRIGQISLSNDCVNWSANGYRLPTEAEWEKAARGGAAGMRFPWSDVQTISRVQANYYGNTVYAYDLGPNGFNPLFTPGGSPCTSPVGYFAPNGYGLYDMAGNVGEWCWDWYDHSWYSNGSATQNDTSGPTSSPYPYRVVRGGGWGGSDGSPYSCRVACRGGDTPGTTSITRGFRAVRR